MIHAMQTFVTIPILPLPQLLFQHLCLRHFLRRLRRFHQLHFLHRCPPHHCQRLRPRHFRHPSPPRHCQHHLHPLHQQVYLPRLPKVYRLQHRNQHRNRPLIHLQLQRLHQRLIQQHLLQLHLHHSQMETFT